MGNWGQGYGYKDRIEEREAIVGSTDGGTGLRCGAFAGEGDVTIVAQDVLGGVVSLAR